MFKKVDSKISFPKNEEKILKFWDDNNTFEKSLEQTEGKEEFAFYDGPPFATGLPHYGHLVPGMLKDIIPRYQTMQGKHVSRRWGWDCHGLPVEFEMEKELGLKSKKDVIEYGIDNFNEKCRSIVLRYTSEWEKIIKRSGRWVDFESAYRSMDLNYMESIWWVFKTLWDKGLIYEGYRISPYCTRCATTLSNFEVNQGYKEVKDPAITMKFQDAEDSSLFYLAWTTTPWTLPSNMALACGPEIDYVEVEDNDSKERYILGKDRLSAYYRKEEEYTVIREFKGKDLENRRYIPLFPYFENLKDKAYKIVLADYVSTEDGTGIVHTAPGFGEDDHQTGLRYDLPTVIPVDDNGEFTEEITDYAGRYVKDADQDIIIRLKKEGKLIKKETIPHNYPHCWRCDTPLLYKAISTWFVKVEDIKELMIKNNQLINWVPEHIKDGRFGKWLEGSRDWNISRSRFWGNPLPIWKCEECGEYHCVGSINELEKLSGVKVNDLHKHYVDKIHLKCEKCGGQMTRIEEVLDCWFESGSMPYAQQHFPFENKDLFDKIFPADFIAEGLDQTRGWFYTSTVIASALFDKPMFKNCIVNGMVLAEDGKKMSKSLKNYPEPTEVIEKYGADALRFYLVNSAVIRGEELKFSESGVLEVVKTTLLPLWNSFVFFTTYANIDKWEVPSNIEEAINNTKFDNELDRWLLSSLQHLVSEVTEAIDNYKIYKAVEPINKFIDQLTNWYIRRSRRRFWKSENDNDKTSAYLALYYTLLELSKVIAPILPFIAEEMFQILKTDDMPESVHLCDYPKPKNELLNLTLEKRMSMIQVVVSLGRSLRTQNRLKIRQPLSEIFVVNANKDDLEIINDMADLVIEELNVKKVTFDTDESKMLSLSAKPNFKKLGKTVGKNMKKLQQGLLKLSSEDIVAMQKGASKKVEHDDFGMEVSIDDIMIVREEKPGLKILNEGAITVGLNTTLNDNLISEGYAREVVNKIQNLRKEKDFNVVDRIKVMIQCEDDLKSSVENHMEYLSNETLAKEVTFHDKISDGVEFDINDKKAKIDVAVCE